MRHIILSMLLLSAAVRAEDQAREAGEHSDLDMSVSLDAGEQSGEARGSVLIHADRQTVWALISSCPEAMHILPGLQSCEVLETAQDHSWQRIRQVLNYSWFVPTLTYELRVDYQAPSQIHVERLSGDLRTLTGSWQLVSEAADSTRVHYALSLAPGFWVPHWLTRAALRHDLPAMLRALKARAESIFASAGAPAAPAAH